MTSVDVAGILKATEASKASLPSIEVTSRPLEPSTIDLGNLLLVEENEIQLDRNDKEHTLKESARMNAQLLFNAIWDLPTHKTDEVTVVDLPPPSTKLPREKPVPQPKALTKWEQYAKEKGIKKKKKTKLVWDDVVKEWVPRYGYKKAKVEEAKNWMMEIKDNADPMEDPFEKDREAKRERVAKNELQRLRNIARTKKIKVPGVGLTPVATEGSGSNPQPSSDLKKAADLAKKSTASLGKFQEKLKTPLEKVASKGSTGKKRKFDPLVPSGEKEKNLKILEQVTNKKPRLDVNKAVGVSMNAEQTEASKAKKSVKGKKGGRGKGGGQGKGGRGGKASRGKGSKRGAGRGGGGKGKTTRKGKR